MRKPTGHRCVWSMCRNKRVYPISTDHRAAIVCGPHWRQLPRRYRDPLNEAVEAFEEGTGDWMAVERQQNKTRQHVALRGIAEQERHDGKE